MLLVIILAGEVKLLLLVCFLLWLSIHQCYGVFKSCSNIYFTSCLPFQPPVWLHLLISSLSIYSALVSRLSLSLSPPFLSSVLDRLTSRWRAGGGDQARKGKLKKKVQGVKKVRGTTRARECGRTERWRESAMRWEGQQSHT